MIELFEGVGWQDVGTMIGIITDVIVKIMFLALLVESTIETLKPLWDEEKGWNKTVLFALGVSIPITVLSGLNLYSALGIHLRIPAVSAPWNDVFELVVGSLATGIILSRGANYLHELYKRLEVFLPTMKKPTKAG